MHLNIKNVETRELAMRLAAITGDSITGAVTRALKAEIARVDNKNSRRQRIHALIMETAPRLADGPGSADIDALLYDDKGLPK